MSKTLYKKSAAVILSAFIIASSSSVAASAAEIHLGTANTQTDITIPLNKEPIILEQNKVYTLPQIHSGFFAGVNYNITTNNNRIVKIQNHTIVAVGTGTATINIKFANGLDITKKITVKAPEITIKPDQSSYPKLTNKS